MDEVPSPLAMSRGGTRLSTAAPQSVLNIFALIWHRPRFGPGSVPGKTGAKLKTDDSVEEVLHVMSHDSILFFTEDGVARSLKAYQIPEASRTAIGAAITQVLPAVLQDRV